MKVTDQNYLRQEQYKTPANLQARINLHQLFSTNPYPWFQWVFDQLDWEPIQHALEIGCGPGDLWRANLDWLPGGLRLVLTDLSPGMVAEARTSLAGSISALYLSADAQRLPFTAEQFDLVIANHMLYHVPDLLATLNEITTVLRPGGVLCAATNGSEHFKELRALLAEFSPENDLNDQSLARFSLESAWEILASAFPEIELRLYKDHLQVTDGDALLGYINSGVWAQELQDTAVLGILKQRIQDQIDQHGYLHITKSLGIFLARKSPATKA